MCLVSIIDDTVKMSHLMEINIVSLFVTEFGGNAYFFVHTSFRRPSSPF